MLMRVICGLIMALCSMYGQAVSLGWIKKNVMDVSPLNLFFEVAPRDKWLDPQENNPKNTLLSMAAQGIIRTVPTVGTKVKILCCDVTHELMGKDTSWTIGPLPMNSKTASYYTVNALYSLLFAHGTLKQRVLFTLYKLFMKKLPAYHIAHHCCVFGQLVGVNGTLVRLTNWWMAKKEYTKVITDISYKVFKAIIEVCIDECVGCYIVPRIYGL